MLLPSFDAFKKRESRTFNYIPRHYKPEEDPETYGRRKLGSKKEEFLRKEKFKQKMQDQWGSGDAKKNSAQHRAVVIRLLILLMLSIGFIYFMGDMADNFFKIFDK